MKNQEIDSANTEGIPCWMCHNVEALSHPNFKSHAFFYQNLNAIYYTTFCFKDSFSSTEEDPDVGDVKSFLFMQRKPTLSDDDQMDSPMDSSQHGGNGASRKRPAVEDVGQAKGKKQRLEFIF